MTSYNAAGTPAEIDSTIVQLAITQASAKVSAWTNEVWGMDAEGNTVSIPFLVQSITINIAAYYATLSYRKNKPLVADDPIILRYNDAIADLKAIQTGAIDANPYDPSNGLSGAGGAAGSSGNHGAVRNTVARTFTGRDSNTHIDHRGVIAPDTYPDAWGAAPWLSEY
jgi:phage gp36-like protein